MYVTITRQTQDKLHQWEYRFYVHTNSNQISVHLQDFTESKRETRRHSWKPQKTYYRVDMRNNNPRDLIPHVPYDVVADAREAISNKIEFISPEKERR